MSKTKIVDQSKLCADIQDRVEQTRKFGKRTGMANKAIDEAVPFYEKADVENIITGENNNFIILGRDRPSHRWSGFGGKGATQAARIDLIAGMGSSFSHEDGSFGPPCEKTIVNPNFALDGARIYLSQTAHIDKYMGIAPSNHLGESRTGASAVGIKADAVRIHARQDVKIVTGRARFEGLGKKGEKLSNGDSNEVVGTISFIAGNYIDAEETKDLNFLKRKVKPGASKRKLQPLVKGDHLEECLRDAFTLIKEMAALMKANGMAVDNINAATTGHIHNVVYPPLPTIPSPTYAGTGAMVGSTRLGQRASESSFDKRVDAIMQNYLGKEGRDNRGSMPMSPKYILSKYVFTT
tara:strand:+ start:2007 stop:3062 length:1056 start_codon:yes stop_codon:yes gene_type:complete